MFRHSLQIAHSTTSCRKLPWAKTCSSLTRRIRCPSTVFSIPLFSSSCRGLSDNKKLSSNSDNVNTLGEDSKYLHQSHLPTVPAYVPNTLVGALFCGHLVTDLDSIAGAIGAAELYGGVPCRASEVNSETSFALDYWGVEQPRPVEVVLLEYPNAGVCLVDHQQTSQLHKSIDVSHFSLFFLRSNNPRKLFCVD